MSTPTAKRRRIDAASSTLSKPFRSPFRTPFKSPLKTQPSIDSNQPATPSNLKPSTPVLTEKPVNLPSSPKSTLRSLNTPRPARTKKAFTSPRETATLNADPDIAPLLRAQRELEKQLREVKEQLEVAEQARKIERESRKKDPDGMIDGELVELIEKWKGASRQAAEELFGKVRDRVNRMGGPRAWKESQKKQQEFQNGGWDEEPTNNNNNSDDDDGDEKKGAEKRDIYAEYNIDPETENEKSQRAKGVGDTGEMPGQEDEFTMAMMLRTLNVDLEIIGYDREEQRWIDAMES